MIAIELDGIETHGTSTALRSDDLRQNEIVLRGWRVLRFTWEEVTKHPDRVAATIRSALRGALRSG
jgi:very-short-patch-repair endonuclease